MTLKDFRIQTKLLVLIGLLTLVTVAVSAVGITRLTGMSASLIQVDTAGDAQLSGARMNQNVIALNRAEYRVAADPSADTVRAATAVTDENRKMFTERLGRARAVAGPDEAVMLDRDPGEVQDPMMARRAKMPRNLTYASVRAAVRSAMRRSNSSLRSAISWRAAR